MKSGMRGADIQNLRNAKALSSHPPPASAYRTGQLNMEETGTFATIWLCVWSPGADWEEGGNMTFSCAPLPCRLDEDQEVT